MCIGRPNLTFLDKGGGGGWWGGGGGGGVGRARILRCARGFDESDSEAERGG